MNMSGKTIPAAILIGSFLIGGAAMLYAGDSEVEKHKEICAELRKSSGQPYEYMEGVLLSKYLYTSRNTGDCFQNCPPVDEETERAYLTIQLQRTGEKAIGVSIGGATAELKKFESTIRLNQKYGMCAALVMGTKSAYNVENKKFLWSK